ncbi:MAG: nucleotidyltransferase domain-containing protein, partial [Candidatus Aenigmarchaeota archaeon]|nr:nucleotidyltransferase domain-containing protein [Candidatus Aenigmarchaeota archaeon]
MTKKIYNDRCFEILGLYSKNWKTEFYTREIARLTNNELGTVQLSLAKLKDDKIIVSKIRGKHKYWSLNLKNPLTKYFLEMMEIYKTSEFLVRYNTLFSFFKEIINLNIAGIIIIFGSYAKAETAKNSDIDILVIGDKKQKIEKIEYLLP